MARVLHLTPHMGGGVGKAISGLVAQAARAGSPHEHAIVCLERPEKPQFVDLAGAAGCPLVLAPDAEQLRHEIEAADILQIEFWNHPATVEALCVAPLPPMRLLVWCHVSGLHYPAIPPGLMAIAHRFLFTSACSFEAPEVQALPAATKTRLGVVSSGGLDALPSPSREAATGPLRAGYLGSLNFSKLHPDYVAWLASAAAALGPNFRVRMIGDETNRAELERQCVEAGRPGLLEFAGYTTDVGAALATLDVLVYLLNPRHYGTAENALLEAMAMGVVPIVLDNAAERHIIDDGDTGIVVRSPDELAAALRRLAANPSARTEMGHRAAAAVRTRYSHARMEREFGAHYDALLAMPKATLAFTPAFGATPADWFRAFHRDAAMFGDDGDVRLPGHLDCHGLFERTKGSVFHFLSRFPHDALLGRWAEALRGHMGT